MYFLNNKSFFSETLIKTIHRIILTIQGNRPTVRRFFVGFFLFLIYES